MIERCRIKGVVISRWYIAGHYRRREFSLITWNAYVAHKVRFQDIYDACRTRFDNYEVSRQPPPRFQTLFLPQCWFSPCMCTFFFSFYVRECDWHAENNMRERSLAILTLSRPRKSRSFIKITCPVSRWREGESINVANVGVASNKFIARKIYNHRVFITVCLNARFSLWCRKCWNSWKKTRDNISRLRASKVSVIICGSV